MSIFVDGTLTPPADAGSLDGIPADLQPAGSGQDGYVVTYVDQDGALELKPASGGGMTNPMTAAGDLIAGIAPIVGGLATPARLAAGSAGYILRVVGGTPVWRELFAPGLLAARPAAAAAREGQWYWSTNAAAGLELAVCTHQGSGVYAWVTVPYSVTATGVALVQAADAAAAQTALGLTTPSLDTGNGWTINNVAGCVATFPGNGIARFTLSSSPIREDAESTNVERPFAYDGGAQYRVSVRPRAITQTAGAIYPCLYLRNASRIVLFVWVYPSNQVCAGAWTSGGIGLQPPGFVSQTFNLDGTSSFNFNLNGLNIPFVSVGTSYLPTAVYTHSLNFVPTHIGVCVNCAAGSSGVVDFSDLQIRML